MDKQKIEEICETCKNILSCKHREVIHKDNCKVNNCDLYQDYSNFNQKEIEEMAKDLFQSLEWDIRDSSEIDTFETALNLTKMGYRKIEKNSVVLTKEELELLTNDLDKGDYGEFESGFSQGYKQARKETAEKIFKEMQEFFIPFDKKSPIFLDLLLTKLETIVKQIGVEKKE